jgi:hypothetical protein
LLLSLFEIAKQRGDTDHNSSGNAFTSFKANVSQPAGDPAADRSEEIAEAELIESF